MIPAATTGSSESSTRRRRRRLHRQGCVDMGGHIVGEGFTVQGNMLVSGATVEAMAAAARETAAELA